MLTKTSFVHKWKPVFMRFLRTILHFLGLFIWRRAVPVDRAGSVRRDKLHPVFKW